MNGIGHVAFPSNQSFVKIVHDYWWEVFFPYKVPNIFYSYDCGSLHGRIYGGKKTFFFWRKKAINKYINFLRNRLACTHSNMSHAAETQGSRASEARHQNPRLSLWPPTAPNLFGLAQRTAPPITPSSLGPHQPALQRWLLPQPSFSHRMPQPISTCSTHNQLLTLN